MIRLLTSLAVLAAFALGLAWLADQPGEVTVPWQGKTYHLPPAKAAIFLLAVFVVLLLAWGLLRTLWRLPRAARRAQRKRKRARGFHAVTRGMIAVGSGDVRAAQRQALEAERILGAEPLALLLRAQAAQLSGDRRGAEDAFKAMLADQETKPLALRGLFIEAKRRNDRNAARMFAAEAVKAVPASPWAGAALLEFQTFDKDWGSALATLQRNADNKLIDRALFKRHRAVLLAARGLEKAERHPDEARQDALEAVKLAPSLTPAAVLAARLLANAGEVRKAMRIIEAAWREHPHPDLAEAAMAVRPGDSARDRLARAEILAAHAGGDPEGALALARAALAAREFHKARMALAPLLETGASERVYVLMADIEQAEHGETGKLREWLSRAVRAPRDPTWTADGVVSDVWLPMSPVTGRLDAFEWKTPVEHLAGPVMDHADNVLADGDEPEAPALAAPQHLAEALPPAAQNPPPRFQPGAASGEAPLARKAKRASSNALPIIATRPAPDDPGPDDENERDDRKITL